MLHRINQRLSNLHCDEAPIPQMAYSNYLQQLYEVERYPFGIIHKIRPSNLHAIYGTVQSPMKSLPSIKSAISNLSQQLLLQYFEADIIKLWTNLLNFQIIDMDAQVIQASKKSLDGNSKHSEWKDENWNKYRSTRNEDMSAIISSIILFLVAESFL